MEDLLRQIAIQTLMTYPRLQVAFSRIITNLISSSR
ncbi:hypothetical protein LINGRAHAP2_LOCUS20187 [Linum grandiflorum]